MPDKALVLYPAWCTGKRRGVKPDCIPGEESQPGKRQLLLHPGTRVWQPSTKKPDGSRWLPEGEGWIHYPEERWRVPATWCEDPAEDQPEPGTPQHAMGSRTLWDPWCCGPGSFKSELCKPWWKMQVQFTTVRFSGFTKKSQISSPCVNPLGCFVEGMSVFANFMAGQEGKAKGGGTSIPAVIIIAYAGNDIYGQYGFVDNELIDNGRACQSQARRDAMESLLNQRVQDHFAALESRELLDVFIFFIFFICRVQDCLVSGVATWICLRWFVTFCHGIHHHQTTTIGGILFGTFSQASNKQIQVFKGLAF